MKAKAREKGLHTIDLLHRRSTKAGHCNRCRISITFANRRKQTAVLNCRCTLLFENKLTFFGTFEFDLSICLEVTAMPALHFHCQAAGGEASSATTRSFELKCSLDLYYYYYTLYALLQNAEQTKLCQNYYLNLIFENPKKIKTFYLPQ